ncbi:MAG: hypothetical protein H0U82_04985, partial [Actinobacteria bacterium]|nr:hypothetical protein [Actinomycetota bacterium]
MAVESVVTLSEEWPRWRESQVIWESARFANVCPTLEQAQPAGVFCIGGVLVLRDWLQQLRGLLWTMPLVYTSCLASWAIGD